MRRLVCMLVVVVVVMMLVRALFHGLAAAATRGITGSAEHADHLIGLAAALNAHAPGSEIDVNISPDSIYTGALGAALFALQGWVGSKGAAGATRTDGREDRR